MAWFEEAACYDNYVLSLFFQRLFLSENVQHALKSMAAMAVNPKIQRSKDPKIQKSKNPKIFLGRN